MYCGRSDRVAGVVSLSLQVDAIKSKTVLAHHTVDALVAGSPKLMACIFNGTAVPHSQQQVRNQLREERRCALTYSLQQGFFERRG